MALKTLLNVDKIDGFGICHFYEEDDVEHRNEDCSRILCEDCDKQYIAIDHCKNEITFKIQNGPIKEVGVNGCQVDTLIWTALQMIEGLNKDFPCEENKEAIRDLDSALSWLTKRRRDREERDVEGTSQI